ncbi:hypothetical protein HAX54_033199, partial [Datura stramonium]|nr:hypothetical protein [Datura stramonium]
MRNLTTMFVTFDNVYAKVEEELGMEEDLGCDNGIDIIERMRAKAMPSNPKSNMLYEAGVGRGII